MAIIEKKTSNFIDYSLCQTFCMDYYVTYYYQHPQEGRVLLLAFYK